MGPAAAGIYISNSRDVEVFGNAVDSNEGGILLRMVDRETGPDGLLELTNVEVRDNDIRKLGGATGLVNETGNDAYCTSRGTSSRGNTYYLEDFGASRFSWFGLWGDDRSFEEWRAFGNDASGDLEDADRTHPFSPTPRDSARPHTVPPTI